MAAPVGGGGGGGFPVKRFGDLRIADHDGPLVKRHRVGRDDSDESEGKEEAAGTAPATTYRDNGRPSDYYRLPDPPPHALTRLPAAPPMPGSEVINLFLGVSEKSGRYKKSAVAVRGGRWGRVHPGTAMERARTLCRDLLEGAPLMAPPFVTHSPFDRAGAIGVIFNAMLHSHNPETGLSSVCVTMDVQPKVAKRDLNLPVDLHLLLDRSASMNGPRFAQALVAIKAVARTLGPDDRLSLTTFDVGSKRQLSLGRVDVERLDAILDGLKAEGLGTQILDSLVGSCLAAFEISEKEIGQRAQLLLFITDGAASDVAFREGTAADIKYAIDMLGGSHAENLVICPVGIGLDTVYIEHLQTLAEKTGGQFFDGSKPEDLPGIFEKAHALASCKSLRVEPESIVTFGRNWKVINVYHDGPESARFPDPRATNTVSGFRLDAIPNKKTASVTFQLVGAGPLAARVDLACTDVIHAKGFWYSPEGDMPIDYDPFSESVASRMEYVNYRAQMCKFMAITERTPTDTAGQMAILDRLKHSISAGNLPLLVTVVQLINAMENVVVQEQTLTDPKIEMARKELQAKREGFLKDLSFYREREAKAGGEIAEIRKKFDAYAEANLPALKKKVQAYVDRIVVRNENGPESDEEFHQRKEAQALACARHIVPEEPCFQAEEKRLGELVPVHREAYGYVSGLTRGIEEVGRQLEQISESTLQAELQKVRDRIPMLLQYHVYHVYHLSQLPVSVQRTRALAIELQRTGRFSCESGSAAENTLNGFYERGVHMDRGTCIKLLMDSIEMPRPLAGIITEYAIPVLCLRATTQGPQCFGATYLTARTDEDEPTAERPVGSAMVKSNVLRVDFDRDRGVTVLCPQDVDTRFSRKQYTVGEFFAEVDGRSVALSRPKPPPLSELVRRALDAITRWGKQS